MGGVGVSESPSIVTWGQAPTVPMQSVKLGGGALGFAFPKIRFMLGSRKENPNTKAKNRKRKQSHLRLCLDFRAPMRKRSVPIGISRSFFRLFISAFRGRRAPGGWRCGIECQQGGVASLKDVGVTSDE